MLRVSGGPGHATVPDVTGETEAAATAAARNAPASRSTSRERGEQRRRRGPGDPPGARRRGRRPSVGSTVTHRRVQRARGGERAGRPQPQPNSAEATLDDAGLELGRRHREPSTSAVARARSSARTPAATARVPRAAPSVTVRRGLGAAADDRAERSIGNTADRRPAKLQNAGFKVVTSDTAASTEPAGTWSSSRPARGHLGRAGQHDHDQRQQRPRPAGRGGGDRQGERAAAPRRRGAAPPARAQPPPP